MGLGGGFLNVRTIAWLQARVEPSMVGRVMSLVMLGSVGLAPLSYAVAGVLVDVHATLMFIVAGVIVIVAALAGFAGGLPASMRDEASS
jgi:hypothetical protein